MRPGKPPSPTNQSPPPHTLLHNDTNLDTHTHTQTQSRHHTKAFTKNCECACDCHSSSSSVFPTWAKETLMLISEYQLAGPATLSMGL